MADAAAEPRGLLQDEPAAVPPTWAFRLLAGDAAEEQNRRDLFGGLALPRGGEGAAGSIAGFVRRIGRPAARRRETRLHSGDPRAIGTHGLVGRAVVAQTNQLTRDLDEASAGRIVYQLADRYRRTGRWALAAETFQAMADRYPPQHSLTPQALLWLVQFYASEEAAWRVEPDSSQHERRYQRALALAKDLERVRPEWFAEPRLQFPLAVAFRNLNQPRQAENCYLLQSRNGRRDAWGACAQSELRLADSKAAPPKPVLVCVRAESRPHLDGRLDDPVWKRAKPVALQSPQHDDGAWPSEVMLAYDAEFLYFAGRCARAGEPGPEAPSAGGSRPRDADLSAHDRVELLLDLDRDLVTFCQFTVDDRGWTNDRWWGDATWDPTWYVAAAASKEAWTFESSHPVAAAHGPAAAATRPVGHRRATRAPGRGFQAWSSPAAIVPLPEGFGYLIFE